MKQRCYNKNNPRYKDYGGRGITVGARWLGPQGYAHFLEDMGPRPGRGFSIERKKNELGYSKDNCVWATRSEQQNNMRSNIIVTFNGRTQTLRQWADELGLAHNTLYFRHYRGWSIERMLTKE